jgi:hypothetical protein
MEQANASLGVAVLFPTVIESAMRGRNQDYVFARRLASVFDEPLGTLAGCKCVDVTQLEHLDGTIDGRCYRVFF